VTRPGIAERVSTLTVMCIPKASIITAVTTVAATWVANRGGVDANAQDDQAEHLPRQGA
jgi:hypothetical protein